MVLTSCDRDKCFGRGLGETRRDGFRDELARREIRESQWAMTILRERDEKVLNF